MKSNVSTKSVLFIYLTAFSIITAQPTVPVNPNATPEVRALLQMFGTIYGKKMLSGQHDQFNNNKEFDYIKNVTGKEPAVRGFDFIFYTEASSLKGETESAIKWHNRGGIVTFQWHWNAPMGGHSFATDKTSFDVSKAVISGTAENIAIMKDLDMVAKEMKKLSDAKVPVLFRPLHEAEGKWFWWGAKGPEPCKKLWKIIFDYYTNHYKFNNIIWTWNQNTNPNFDWYPGDSVIDILSTDIYTKPLIYVSWISDFAKLRDFIKDKKFIAVSENGPIPDPDKCFQDKAHWFFFATWWGDFISTKYVSTTQLKKVYSHPDVITLDEMPGVWTSIGIPLPGDNKPAQHNKLLPRALPDRSGWIIPVELGKGGEVRLGIFNTAGQCVRDIIFSNLVSGRVELPWDETDGKGNAVNPGAYVYRIKATDMPAQSAVINVW